MSLTIPPRDPRIHVFSVSDGKLKLAHQTYLSQLSEQPADTVVLPDAFGAAIDATYAEVFAIRDIEPMGLRDYLTQAHDIPAETLARDAARLDGLAGDVVVLAAGSLDGVRTLYPRPELTHIGSYLTVEADNAPRDLPPAVKEPHLAEPDSSPEPPVRRGLIPAIVVLALLLAALLTFFVL